MASIPRSEFPRPDFVRQDWLCLNGEWQFFADKDRSVADIGQAMAKAFPDRIVVPFCPESKMSGIGRDEGCEVFWYKRTLVIAREQLESGAALLKFGAVDYEAHVWVNGAHVGSHRGGHVGFGFDVAPLLVEGENVIVVRATDDARTDKPRGKQSWTGQTFGCWYTPTSGIWQSVWLEFTGARHITGVKLTPDVDRLSCECEVSVNTNRAMTVVAEASMEHGDAGHGGVRRQLGTLVMPIANGCARMVFAFEDPGIRMWDDLLWSPDSPRLIDVKLTLRDGDAACDTVDTYFGMRKIHVDRGVVLLNNTPLYQRLVLDQGYWPDSLLTPPSDEAIIKDIELTKAMGFNGARKHQKCEDPRYYYWADRMGLLVWGELPSPYAFNSHSVLNAERELAQFILRDYNHPCIVTWVPLNESWGVQRVASVNQQQHFQRALAYLAKALDPTRLVSANDGWEQTGAADICAIHDYGLFPSNIAKYDEIQRIMDGALGPRMVYAEGNRYDGKPIIMTEYGGVAFVGEDDQNWGYFGRVKDEAEFLDRIGPVTRMLIENPVFWGFCYTQLTDVMQEVNGLLDEHRNPKLPVDKLRAVFGMAQYR